MDKPEYARPGTRELWVGLGRSMILKQPADADNAPLMNADLNAQAANIYATSLSNSPYCQDHEFRGNCQFHIMSYETDRCPVVAFAPSSLYKATDIALSNLHGHVPE